MKKLKRMLLIHWHNYEKELIPFDMINFLTGKTAAGKSTIIDALQLVLLGDTNGAFFNKAANQKSARTLRSYLFGEMGDDGDAGFRYMRNGRFTSYVALEFEDTDRKSLFVTGIVCDCFKDQSYEFKWLILHSQGFPEDLFIDPDTHTPYDISGLKTALARLCGKGQYELIDTNKRYQEVTLGKFGQIKSKYRTLLKKAVPFSPIADIEQFITESICDVKSNIDVEQMQSDIRQYKSLEEDARQAQERIGFLKEIRSVSQSYDREKEKYLQQSYIVLRAELDQLQAQETDCKGRLEQLSQTINQHLQEMGGLKQEQEGLSSKLAELEEAYQGSDLVRRETDLRRQLADLEQKIHAVTQEIRSALSQARSYGQQWKDHLARSLRSGFEPSGDYAPIILRMANLTEDELWAFPFEEAADQMEELRRELTEYQGELRKRAAQLKNSRQELEATIRDLKNGIKPFPDQVRVLKRLLEEELFALHKQAVEVPVLADLLEIRDPLWRNAIEGYLDKQKFYLLVPEEYFQDALKIYDRKRGEQEVYDAGLVDIGKLRKTFDKQPLSGSLAEEIETSHPAARLYADYLLGQVMKCASTEELNQHRTAITPSCMLYKGYVSRKLNPARYATPFIGRRSMELLMEQKEAELARENRLYEETAEAHRHIAQAASAGILSTYEAGRHSQALGRRGELEELTARRGQVQEEYDSLDLLYLERMKQQINTLKEELREKEQRWHSLDKRNASLQTQIDSLKKQELPEIIGRLTAKEGEIRAQFEGTWIQETGEPRFQEVKSQEGGFSQSLRDRYFSAMRQTENQREKLRSERTRKRSEYNSRYQMPYDVDLESNRYFDQELDELEQIRLPEYAEKIRDSKEKAYEQFRDDFIAKIKSNIESVTQQLEELNDSLKKSVFGTDRYRFVKSPRPEYRNYYDMIMDPLLMDTGGWNIASQSFNEKYQKEIDELFQLLIFNETNVSAERRAEYERSIRKFTDYKTYLVFDLIVTDDMGNEQRLSRTLLKKSGGETQIPFYIALLASFSQVCRVRSRSQNNTIRIIILDEAFSKMDGERIQESIHLLRRFGLQAIFSAPPDKIPDIAPLVDRNIAVYKDSRHSFTRLFDPKEIEELTEE